MKALNSAKGYDLVELTGGGGESPLTALSLRDLFTEAEKYGNVGIFSDASLPPPYCYKCNISFESIPGTSVQASSDYKMSIEDALVLAVHRAKKIAEHYSGKIK